MEVINYEEEIKELEKEIEQKNEILTIENSDAKPVKIWIHEMTREGIITIAFNQQLIIPKRKIPMN